jgi:hypothetical protein
MGRFGIALLAATTLVAPSAIAGAVLAPTIFRAARLASNSVTGFSAGCPRGYVAASAGVSAPATGTTVLSVRPAGNRAFIFRFGNPAKNPARRVTVAVACRRLAGQTRGVFLRVSPLTPRTVLVPSGGQRSATRACPAGTAAAGAGVDLAPGRRAASAGFRGNPLSIRRMSAGVHSFSFTVRNSGATARPVALAGNCITVVAQAPAARRRLHVKVISFLGAVEPGRRKVARSCPQGWVSLAAGYGVASPAVTVEGAAAVGDGGRWSVASTAAGPTQVELDLTCGRVLP